MRHNTGASSLAIVIGLVVVIAIIGAIYYALTPRDGSVTIEEQFDGKIVYTTQTSQNPDPFEAHCEERGGQFNQCGTICAPDAEACAALCAFTCTLPNNSNQ